MLVIYDDAALPLGRLRFREQGSAGGHNGIKSLDAHCGLNYRRLRLGIGHPGDKSKVHNHVLGDFAKVDAEWLDPLLQSLADNAGMLLRGDDNAPFLAISAAGYSEASVAAGWDRVVAFLVTMLAAGKFYIIFND